MSQILIVDDQPDARETLAELLELEGYPVATAANGQEALAYLRSNPLPSLILLDLMMPVMNGWEFRRRQLADPALAAIPVAVVSGADRVEQGEAGLGAVQYFIKPVEFETLLAAVGSYC